MLNDIKLDGMAHSQTTIRVREGKSPGVANPTTNEGISISSHLSDMAKTLLADDDSMSRKLKMEEITRKIYQREYHVDLNSLAATLSNGILSVK